jgi:hypothetical protein
MASSNVKGSCAETATENKSAYRIAVLLIELLFLQDVFFEIIEIISLFPASDSL